MALSPLAFLISGPPWSVDFFSLSVTGSSFLLQPTVLVGLVFFSLPLFSSWVSERWTGTGALVLIFLGFPWSGRHDNGNRATPAIFSLLFFSLFWFRPSSLVGLAQGLVAGSGHYPVPGSAGI